MSPLQREQQLTCNAALKTRLCLRVLQSLSPPQAGPADAELVQVHPLKKVNMF